MNTRVKTMSVAPGLHPHLVVTALLGALLLCLASAAEPNPAAPATTDEDAKAEEDAAKLLELFESDSDITNSLDMVLVHVPQGYRVAQYEVTQAQYQTVMGSNPSKFPGAQRPVEQVSWSSAKAFCDKLTQKDKDAGVIPPGYAYALPTEAQWEHYVDEARIEDSITSHLGDRRNTENVGGLPPNQFGLHDTRGNVWEWCASPVARGGSWRSHEDYLAISFRYTGDPSVKLDDIGFRVVLQASTKP
jgi:formylglycine-generating enzyme required for sulfatase activity